MATGCDIIADWNDSAHSGEGGRLDQLDGLIQDFMHEYGFGGAEVGELPGLFEDEGVPAKYDPDSNTIFFDPDYLAGDSITPDEAVYLGIHEAIHAMDVLEDGGLDVGESAVAAAAFGLAADQTDECQSEEPESGAGGDTGEW
jgi:hypothetical protein